MEDHISPLTNSSPHRTDTRIHPHSFPMPHTSETRPAPINRYVFLFHFLVIDPFRSSSGPSACGSPFDISYAFLFSLCSCSAVATQHRPPFRFPFLHRTILHLFSYRFSDVVAYPEPYLELQFPLRSVLYKVTRPLVCSLASSTQSSLVSSLPRFALRPSHLKPSLTRNGSLRTLRLFVRSSLGYSTQCEPHPIGDYSRTLPIHRRLLERHSRYGSDRRLL